MKKTYCINISLMPFLIFFFFLSFNCRVFSETVKDFSIKKAINLTLKHNNDILIKKESVKISKGDIKLSQSKFDTVVNPSISYQHSETPVSESAQSQVNTLTAGINISKQFRTGITGTFTASTIRAENIASSQDPTNQSTIGFSINVPLLEGLGVEAAASDELASKSNLLTTKYSLTNTVSKSIYQTTVYYWNYLLSVKNLAEYRESLARTETILKQVKILIEKNARPRADIEQILASLANKKATVSKSEQSVISNRNSLASLLGLSTDNFKIVTLPSTDFPSINKNIIKNIISIKDKLISASLNNRFDYIALKQSERTTQINLIGALDKLKNNLDLTMNVSYKRLEQEKNLGAMIDSFWKERPGFNINMLLNYKWPIENSYAKGLVQRYQSLLKQNIYNREQLGRNIYSNIQIAVSDLENSYDNLVESENSVAYYKKAILNERKKYRLGMSTIIDVINLEDRLTNANINKISANYKLAAAIVKLQYETGKLIEKNKDNNFTFKLENILSVNNLMNFE